MKKSIIIISALLMLSQYIYSQSFSHPPEEFRKSEEQSWRELIAASQNFSERDYFDVLFYNINVDIKIHTRYITGNVLCRFKSLKENLQFIVLDLHNALKVDSIKGNVNSFEVIGDSIKIFLDNSLNYGDVTEIEVFYRGVPELANEVKGLRYETHGLNEPVIATLSTPYLAHYWYPCKDGPGDKADSVYINITIPDTTIRGIPLIAVSNGVLENIVIENGMKTFQWRERYPIVTYYVMAAISNYRTFQHVFETESRKIFPIDYYVFDDHLSIAQTGVAQLPEAMELFSELFGEYPFADEKYGMTQLGYYGAIENQTNTITNNLSLSWFSTSVHELAHMWFGDMITCKTWNHAWLNEGFATYSEALWAESVGGFEAYKSYISTFEYFYEGTLYLYDDSDPFGIFIPIIYNKGAYFLHMLRGLLGDEVFFQCLYTYANHPDLKYAYAETDDFKNICEEISGMDLDFFFNQWIYEEGFPHYNFGWSSTEDNDSYKIDVLIEQKQTMGPIFTMPIELVVEYIDGTNDSFILWDSTQSSIYNLMVSKEPARVLFDPDNWILKKVDHVIYNPSMDKGVLLVNGLNWNGDIISSYENKAYWGDLNISFWDLYEAPNAGYPSTLPIPLGNGDLIASSLQNYSTIIWVSGSNDANKFNKELMKNYLDYGGNLVLLTNAGRNFLDDSLQNYLGITWTPSPLSTVRDFQSVHNELMNIAVTANQLFINLFETELTSESSTLLYQTVEGFDFPRGTGVISQPMDKGKLVLLACKPNLFDYEGLSKNMQAIINKFFDEPLTDVEDDILLFEYNLESIYPNPFNPKTTIQFSIPQTEKVILTAYNILGQKINEIVNASYRAGTHKVEWNANNLSSGVYIIKLNAGKFYSTTKALLLK